MLVKMGSMEDSTDFLNRMQSEGRLEAATRYREMLRRRFEAKGATREKARSLAWDEMMVAFPPPRKMGECE